ncbi:hypothetical protein JAAARDRAFT_191416 [Jaapia argillacea MUCL 33604]|uniref:DUF6534 domain-containing protein n=1 Tax=Jaapia argillacea MUCL 33604 TaxID=933084 RepID=A0A067Q912_9AGAM|nr:hypothetical protein JAAARDRAFT_191416 [Jaapia argillacea MUCL 33604]
MTCETASISFGLGIFYIGIVIGAILFGITVMQVYVYYSHYPEDRISLKISIAALCVFDTLHLIACVDIGYRYLITDACNPTFMNSSFWSLRTAPISRMFATRLVQCVYLAGIWKLRSQLFGTGQHRLVSRIVAVVFALLLMGAGPVEIVTVAIIPDLNVEERQWWGWLELATSAFLDCCIAATMILLIRRGLHGGRRMKSLTSTLIQYTIASGLITSLTCVIYLLLYVVDTGSISFGAIEPCVSGVYSISMLAKFVGFVSPHSSMPLIAVTTFFDRLNAREHLRRRLSEAPITMDLSRQIEFRQGSGTAVELTKEGVAQSSAGPGAAHSV